MDLDTTRTRSAYERIIADFQEGKTDILIGTQMVSKGLDFDRVSVVGILNADTMLNYPDFRSYERAFQLMAQVSGRAGRKNKQGLVILQTKSPDLPVIRQVVENDYEQFFCCNIHNLSVMASAGSECQIKGVTQQLRVEVSGGSDIECGWLDAEDVTINASGGSEVSVCASKTISLTASGGSDIHIKGNPEILRWDVSGGSDVEFN